MEWKKIKHSLLSAYIWFYFANKLCCQTHTQNTKISFKKLFGFEISVECGWELMKITRCPVLGSFAVEGQFQSDPWIYTGDLLFISGSFQSFYFIFNNLQFPCNIFWGFILQSMGLFNLGMLTFSQEGVIHSPGNLDVPIIQKLHKHTVPEWKELMNLNRELESLPCTECHQGSI